LLYSSYSATYIFGTGFDFNTPEETVLLKPTEMKKLMLTSILAVLVASMTTVRAQNMQEEYLGLPGDNLNLYAVMDLFQNSETLEGFEKSLNEENSRINNLDLNGDNMVDYIMVADYPDRDVHTIVLRAVIGREDYQDVAVFTVQQLENNGVRIQLVGDEALYGKNYIIEPNYAENAQTPNPGYRGNSNVTVVRTTYYAVSGWPVIRYIYQPHYVIWRSSWYWGYYPDYWNPWRPYYYHYYYGYHNSWNNHYYRHYHHSNHHYYDRYHDFYYSGVRSHSLQVDRGINEGRYKSTYSHPEQRRDGEALYSRTQAERSGRPSVSSASNSQGRRTVSSSDRGQGTQVSRRPTTSTYEKSTSRPVQSQRRETVSTQPRSSAPAQKSETVRTQTRTSAPAQKSETVRTQTRSSAPAQKTETVRTQSRTSAPAQRTETARSQSKSSSPAVSSSRGSSQSQVKSGNSNRSSSSNSRSSSNSNSSSRSTSSKSSDNNRGSSSSRSGR